MGKTRVNGAAVAAVCAALFASGALGQVRGNLVIAINSSRGTFDGASFIDAMRRAQLLDNKNLPPAINAAGNLIGSNGATVGERVVRNGRQIGWRNTTTGAIIVDLDRPTTGTQAPVDLEDAWQSVNNNGRLIIAKHGTLEGGGIAASRGEQASTINGVNTGGNGNAITLTPRAGANITVELPSCNSATSRNGNPSILDAMKQVPGVSANSTGESRLIEPYHRLQYVPKRAANNADIDRELDNYRMRQDGGRDARDFYDWLRRLPAQSLRDALPKNVTVPNPQGGAPIVVPLNWSIVGDTRYERPPNPVPNDDFGAILDRMFPVIPGVVTTVAGVDSGGYDYGSRVRINGLTDNDANPGSEVFLLTQYATVESTLPPDLTTVGGMLALFASDGLAEDVSLTVTFQLFGDHSGDSIAPLLYRFDEATGAWTPLSLTSTLVDGKLITTFTLAELGNGFDHSALIMAPVGVPMPAGTVMLAGAGLLVAGRRRR